MGGEFRPQPFHVLAGPGLRTGERLAVEFDAAILDLVAPVSKIQAESVIEFELPSLFDQRPHEDSTVEAWLQKYLDSGGKDGEIVLEAKCCAKLQLAIDEQPEVCPVFRHLLSQFEVALVAWLEEWPPAEPRREGLCVSSEISPELLELQLHSVLALLGEGGLLAVLSENQAVVDSFRSVAIAWIFKLHSLYGLDILSQHERVTTKSASHLSMLSWDLFQVEELLQSPFFRPQELSLWRFAKRWCVEGTGAPAFAEESEDAESKVEVLPSPNKDEIDGAFSKVLLWDLLPPKDELVVQFAATQSAAAVEGEQTPENSQHGTSKGPTELSTGDPEAEEPQEEKSKTSRPRRVDGSTFVRAERRADCVLKPFEDADALHLRYAEDSTSLRCWNSAPELQVLGGSRQVLVSTVPMTSGGGGRFRFDLRVNSGSGADAAPLFEVGLMADPAAGVAFQVGQPGVCRPLGLGEMTGKSEPFFRFLTVLDMLVEGVRLVVDIDLNEATVSLQNLPDDGQAQSTQSLSSWLAERNRAMVMSARNPGELECQLFKEHAEHLQDLVSQGKLDGALAETFLADTGAKWVLAAEITPEKPEAYHFYVTLPAGMELEIF